MEWNGWILSKTCQESVMKPLRCVISLGCMLHLNGMNVPWSTYFVRVELCKNYYIIYIACWLYLRCLSNPKQPWNVNSMEVASTMAKAPVKVGILKILLQRIHLWCKGTWVHNSCNSASIQKCEVSSVPLTLSKENLQVVPLLKAWTPASMWGSTQDALRYL